MSSFRHLKYGPRYRQLEHKAYVRQERKHHYDVLTDEAKEALKARAKAEVDAEENAIEASLRDRVKTSPLWPLVETAIAATGQPHYRAIETYNQARQTLIEERWAEQGLSFCTGCQKPRPKVRPCVREGRAVRGGSDCSYNSWSWFEDFCSIELLCKKCRQRLVEAVHEVRSDGKTGSVHTNIWLAEQRDGEWWVKRAGFWVQLAQKVDIASFRFSHMYLYDTRVEELERSWDIPPELESYPTAIVIRRAGFNDPVALHFKQPTKVAAAG